MARALPPGPHRLSPRVAYGLLADPLAFLEALAREYGPVSMFQVGWHRVVVVNEPELIRELLVGKHRSFMKDSPIDLARRVLGNGLLYSTGEFHKRQRRLTAPAFHRERVTSYGAQMADFAKRVSDRWRDGATVDMAREMNDLTLSVACRVLFGTDVGAETDELGAAFTEVIQEFSMFRLGFNWLVDQLPLPGKRSWERASERLDRTVYRMISERRQSGQDTGDLLSMLLLATDTEEDGASMTDAQLRDELMTMFLAAHETTSAALAWTWYLLAQHPEAEAKLHQELHQELGGRTPEVADIPRLTWTQWVLWEAMRLYPPCWAMGRAVVEPVELGGWQLEPGDQCLVSQWVTHRDPRFFPEPERFDPTRWEPTLASQRPKFSYFPFSSGPRFCPGDGFAWTEMILALGTLAQRWRPRLLPEARVRPKLRVTLRPDPGIPMRLEARC